MEESVKEKLKNISHLYNMQAGNTNFTALVAGLPGAGKTTFIGTGRKPVLVDSFDPRGAVILKPLVDSREVYVRTFWDEKTSSPTEYSRWEDIWEDDLRTGFLNNFGTYAIDSLTTLIQALSNKIATEKGREPGTLALQDYQPLYGVVRDIIKLTSTQNVDFILTAHLINVQDDLTGAISSEVDTYSKLRSQVPLLFTEKYVINVKSSPSGPKRVLLTNFSGTFRASTQIGAGKFSTEEVPDIKVLLKKAGYPTNDKELL